MGGIKLKKLVYIYVAHKTFCSAQISIRTLKNTPRKIAILDKNALYGSTSSINKNPWI